ncbi:class I SAM-dependent methyltransferase [Niallia sp. XMNu-256]|uniref:class I SAM-dependent methyltransferase n=1 Tax=Niallia sp. XMNu-256 TaxID=3082444 RepID=UPI0030D2DA4D
MSFYNDLTAYYDQIFPLNQTAFSFISQHLPEGSTILDIGAGTGNMAIALAEKGIKVTASEPEETMAQSIQDKASSRGIDLSVFTKSMEEIDEIQGSFDGILCLGNTLPHLSNTREIEIFLKKCYLKLGQNGVLIIQQVNYDRVLTKHDFSFPVIEKEDFTFTRHYEKKDEHILFSTRLTVNEKTIENTMPLFPIISQQLISLLKVAGFGVVNVHGNFKGEAHSIDSPALVIVAKKS